MDRWIQVAVARRDGAGPQLGPKGGTPFGFARAVIRKIVVGDGAMNSCTRRRKPVTTVWVDWDRFAAKHGDARKNWGARGKNLHEDPRTVFEG